MARIQTQAQTTSYGSALSLQDGTTGVEVSFLDSGSLVAGTIKVKDPSDNAIEIPIGANQSYSFALPKGAAGAGNGWRLELKAASGTPTGQVLES